LERKKIYLIRHGQTDYNKRGVVQGSGIDAPLNALGEQQAQAFYEKYKSTAFDTVYTSKLIRSIQSVQKFIDSGIPHISFAGLNEINWGIYEGKIVNNDENQYYHQVTDAWARGESKLQINGGDSPWMVQERQKSVLEHILAQPNEKTILICMHGRAMRIFLCLLLNCDLKEMDSFAHDNLGLYLLDYHENKFSVEAANDVSHLAHLVI
jgi:probable phosphoglycerate mutase